VNSGRKLIVIVLAVFPLIASTGSILPAHYLLEPVSAAQGSVTITAPASTVSIPSLVISSTNCGPACEGSNITGSPRPVVSAVNREEWWSVTVNDTGGLSDLDGVIIYIYETGATIGSFNANKSYGFRWVRKGYNVVTAGDTCPSGTGAPAGCLQELTATGWNNTLTYLVLADTGRPTWSGAGPTLGAWTFAVTLSSSALCTDTSSPNHWNFEADATSKSGSHLTGTRTLTMDIDNAPASVPPLLMLPSTIRTAVMRLKV
jgi:hypothetical protein